MKNLIVKSSFVAFLLSSTFSCDIQEKNIPNEELPIEIKTYVSTHFPSSKIVKAEHGKSEKKSFYEITLDNKVALDFNKKNEVTEIDGKTELPNSVIPPSIKEYVTVNYPNAKITDWELEKKKRQEVKLDNGLKLEFDLKGKFVKIDKG